MGPGPLGLAVPGLGGLAVEESRRGAAWSEFVELLTFAEVDTGTGTRDSIYELALHPVVGAHKNAGLGFATRSPPRFFSASARAGASTSTAMLDAALMLMSSTVTACLFSGVPPKRRGNELEYAGVSAYDTKDGILMLGSFREGQHRRLWQALGRPDLAALSSVADQEEHREVFAAALREVMPTRTAEEWERFLIGINVPGARVRNLAETLALEQVGHRGLLSRFETVPGVERPVTVPVAAFRFDHGGPRADRPPQPLGADTDAVLGELGLSAGEIAGLRRDRVV